MDNLEELKRWVKEELTVTEVNELARHKEKIKELIGITSNGMIVFKVDSTRLSAKENICLHMIGKVYAHVAGYVDKESMSNKELIGALNLPEGTIGRALKELRDKKFIIAEETGIHRILYDKIGLVLDKILRKIKK